MKRVRAGNEFDRHVLDDVPFAAGLAGETLRVGLPTADGSQVPGLSFEHVVVYGETAAGSQRSVDGTEGGIARHVLTRPAVGPNPQAAHRRRGQADGVRRLVVGQSEP